MIASDWAGGFLDAVALRPEAWKALLEDDEAWMFMMPLLLLNGDLEFDDGTDEDAFFAEAPDVIPTCIGGIHRFWKNRSQKPTASRSWSRLGGRRRR